MKKRIFTFFSICLSLASFSQSRVVSPEFLWTLGRVSEPRISPDGKSVLYNVRTFDVPANTGNSDIWIMDLDGQNVKKIAGEPENETGARWSPDGKKIAYLYAKDGDSQIWEMSSDGNNKTKISAVPNGVSNFGYSPKMGYIWYTTDVKLDKTANEIYPDLPKANARIIDNLMYRHWNAWSDFTYSHLFIAKYSAGKVSESPIDIMKDEKFDTPLKPDGGEEQIGFSFDDKKIAYTSKKLNGTEYAVSTNSDIYVYDIETAKTKNITEGMPGYDVNPRFSPDGKSLIWLSMQDAGYEADRNRLFMIDFATNTKKEVLSNFDYSVSNAMWNNKSSMIYFSAGMNGTDNILSYDLSPGNPKPMKQITNMGVDINDFSISEKTDKPLMVAALMSISSPTEIFSIDLDNGSPKQISSVNNEKLKPIVMGNVQKRMIKTSDGKDMLTWIIYPPNFKEGKKYPTLLYCQGGPQSTVSQFFSYRWNFQLMAAAGYIVVAPNRRGLPSFGEEWNDKITGDWGGQACTDYLSAIDEMSKEKFIDKEHMGCVGASYGGYSVYWLAGHHQKRFKAFIAHCGVFNLESEFGSTEEMWFPMHDFEGPYWKQPKPKSYDAFSPHKFVQNWDTPILVIHNEKDFRVPVTQGMEAFTAAQMQKIPSRFLYFPEEGHWVMKPQNSILWQRVFFEWLDQYVKRP